MAIEKPINEILVSIENGEYTIPEFQRGFVWNPKQIKEFFRSLYLKYPSGSFLIWKTKNPSKLRGDKKETNSVFHNLILDGQQRLTTIYTIFKGETPNWYEGVTLRTDLYFNLMEEEFEYYTQMKMKGKKEWINVSDFLKNGGLNQFLIDLNKAENAEVRDFYLSRIHVLTNLESIRTYGYYIKEVSITELEKVVEIFNLVNKSGTTLSASDLALAIITSNWDGIKDRFRKSIAEYEQHKYYLSFNFFTRCLNMVTTNRGKYTSAITEVKSEEYEQAWEKINKSLAVLINVLREHAFIDSTQNISTEYVLSLIHI